MRAADHFHVGIVVEDLDGALDDLALLFGHEWCPTLAVSTPVLLADGETTLDLRFTYSMTTPRVEVIQSIPGTLWMPAVGSGIHHLGYWTNDVAADAALLVARRVRRRGDRRPSRRHGRLGLPPQRERTSDRARQPGAGRGSRAVLGVGRTVEESRVAPVTITRTTVRRRGHLACVRLHCVS